MSESEHFARSESFSATLHGKTNSTVCCLAGRAAKGETLVTCSKKGRLPCEGVLFWRKTTISLLGSLVQRELAAIWQTEGLAVSVSELLIPSVTP